MIKKDWIKKEVENDAWLQKNNFYKFYNVDYIFNSYSSRRLGSPNFGLTPYIIEDKEMSPYYAQGNLIYVRPKNTNEILVGDIITYYENSGKKSRRVA